MWDVSYKTLHTQKKNIYHFNRKQRSKLTAVLVVKSNILCDPPSSPITAGIILRIHFLLLTSSNALRSMWKSLPRLDVPYSQPTFTSSASCNS